MGHMGRSETGVYPLNSNLVGKYEKVRDFRDDVVIPKENKFGVILHQPNETPIVFPCFVLLFLLQYHQWDYD